MPILPSITQAPKQIWAMSGRCGLLSMWLALSAFGKSATVPQIRKACRHRPDHGVYALDLAVALSMHGLDLAFYTEPDSSLDRHERRAYRRAGRSSVKICPAIDLDQLRYEAAKGKLPLVLYDTDCGEGHISPISGWSEDRLLMPLADRGWMAMREFDSRWAAPGIYRQCILVNGARI